tara:strand:+ start:3501 stop:4139 length:639 start_codon:yes stop_codon:yes gene_type:complete
MKKLLALLLLTPLVSGEGLDVAGYSAGKHQTDYDCAVYAAEDTFLEKFTCLKRRGSSDVIIFHSDPHTKLVGKFFRYVLIEKSDLKTFKQKLFQKYGEPDVKAYKGIKEKFGWGNVILESAGGFGLSFNKGPEKNGESIRVTFGECTDIWLNISDCPGLFGIENLNKLIASIYMFNDEVHDLNFNSLVRGRDVRIPLENPDAPTKSMDDIDL